MAALLTGPRVSVYIATSLDGFIARSDGGLDWLEAQPPPPGEDFGYAEFFATVDALVIGRLPSDLSPRHRETRSFANGYVQSRFAPGQESIAA